MLRLVDEHPAGPPFVGRTAELQTFERSLERARGGESAVLLVRGEAGVGKSSLARQWSATAVTRGATVVIGNCVQLTEAALPYAPIIEIVRSLVAERGVAEV